MDGENSYTQLLQKEYEQRTLAETLTEITLALTSLTDPTAVLDQILSQAHRIVPYQAAAIALLVEDHTLQIAHSRGYEQFGAHGFINNLRQLVNDLPIDKEVIQTGQARVVADATQAGATWFFYEDTAWIRSSLIIPIRLHKQTLGLLRMDDPRPEQFTQRDTERMKPIAQAAAIALENARLIEAANKRVALLEAVQQAGLSITSRLELSAVLKTILQSVSSLLDGVVNTHIFLYDGQTLTFGTAYWGNIYHTQPISAPRPDGLTYSVAQSGRPMIVSDMQAHPLFQQTPNWHGGIIGLPLMIEKRVVGVMNVAFDRPYKELEFELFVLTLMAGEAAIAIENARLYEQTQQEIAERKRIESALRQSEMRYRHISELTTDFAYALKVNQDRSVTVEWVTDAFLRITGYELEALYQDAWLKIFHPEDGLIARQRADAILSGRPHNCQFRIITKSGEVRWIRDFIRPLLDGDKGATTYVYGAAQDITEFKRVATALERTQKLESMGIIASGIAHDFNNALTAVMTQSSLTLLKLPEPHPAREGLEKIIRVAEGASELTRQLLTYAGEGQYQLQPVDLGLTLERSLSLLEGVIPKTISIRVEVAPDLPQVLADKGQIQQVLMNLAINAAEAYDGQPGSVIIRLHEENMSAAHLRELNSLMAPGAYLFLEIADEGKGMNQETAARVFDPFFTTKQVGRGLGMAAVQGIIHAHHGHVSFTSEVSKGTTFQILLPVAKLEKIETTSPQPVQTMSQPLTGNILLVDDEAVIRTAVSQFLELSGFSVITAENGKQCVDIFTAQQEEISLVLLDVTMPIMTGKEALAHIRELSPTLPVILFSGLDEADVSATIANSAYTLFIKKPFRITELLAKINTLFAAK